MWGQVLLVRRGVPPRTWVGQALLGRPCEESRGQGTNRRRKQEEEEAPCLACTRAGRLRLGRLGRRVSLVASLKDETLIILPCLSTHSYFLLPPHIRLYDAAVHAITYGLSGTTIWGGECANALGAGLEEEEVDAPHLQRLFKVICTMAKALNASSNVPKYILETFTRLRVS